jgi:hypothetical protein
MEFTYGTLIIYLAEPGGYRSNSAERSLGNTDLGYYLYCAMQVKWCSCHRGTQGCFSGLLIRMLVTTNYTVTKNKQKILVCSIMNQLYISYQMKQASFWSFPNIMHLAIYKATQK